MTGRPVITDSDVRDDWAWFAASQGRRYRLRPASSGGFWLIRRRRSDVFLRVWVASLVGRETDDCDPALRAAWFRCAWPNLNPKTRNSMIAETARAERVPR